MSTAVHKATRRGFRDELRSAIARGELVPHYQPIVDIRSGRVLRLEALARWPDTTAEWVPPVRFVPVAERNGLIGPLLTSMLDQALRDLAGWRPQLPDLRVSMNLSARSLGRTRSDEAIMRALDQAGASPDWLSLEITESVVVNDVGNARRHIERLRARGIRVEVDDFGTGYSSLRYLQLLAVDSVKIDRQFVEASVKDRASQTIVRAVVGLCHELGFEAVAEGVAERDVWDLLAALGCDSVQGHLIAPAMPAAEVAGWLDGWASRSGAFASAVPRRPAGPVLEGTGPRVLVVDDDPGILTLVRDVLHNDGYRVETAANGLEALRSIEARRPSLVLVDMHMPILGGESFMKALRERGIDVPVVVMSAGPAAHRWAAELGAQGAIAKPFGIADLLAVASRFVPQAALLH